MIFALTNISGSLIDSIDLAAQGFEHIWKFGYRIDRSKHADRSLVLTDIKGIFKATFNLPSNHWGLPICPLELNPYDPLWRRVSWNNQIGKNGKAFTLVLPWLTFFKEKPFKGGFRLILFFLRRFIMKFGPDYIILTFIDSDCFDGALSFILEMFSITKDHSFAFADPVFSEL